MEAMDRVALIAARAVVENICQGPKWMQWLLDLTTVQLKSLLIRLLEKAPDLTPGETRILLDHLGTTAGEMTQEELQRWAPAILLARNETLAARQEIREETGDLYPEQTPAD